CTPRPLKVRNGRAATNEYPPALSPRRVLCRRTRFGSSLNPSTRSSGFTQPGPSWRGGIIRDSNLKEKFAQRFVGFERTDQRKAETAGLEELAGGVAYF